MIETICIVVLLALWSVATLGAVWFMCAELKKQNRQLAA